MLTQLDRLSFGRAIPNGALVSDLAWAEFETDTVAAAFPGGYTVINAQGAWRDAATGKPIHEPSTIIEVASDGSPEVEQAILAVARVYKALFQQYAVMRTTSPVRTAFI